MTRFTKITEGMKSYTEIHFKNSSSVKCYTKTLWIESVDGFIVVAHDKGKKYCPYQLDYWPVRDIKYIKEYEIYEGDYDK